MEWKAKGENMVMDQAMIENLAILRWSLWSLFICALIVAFGYFLTVIATKNKKDFGQVVMIGGCVLAIIPVLLFIVDTIILACTGYYPWYFKAFHIGAVAGALCWATYYVRK